MTSDDANDVLDAHELDAVSGGLFRSFARHVLNAGKGDGRTGLNDPAQMFQQILVQLTQGNP
jgi:hypothetical protein